MSDMTQTPCCCHVGCEEPAEWRIVFGDMPDNYTEACSQHVGELLDDDKVSTVYKITDRVILIDHVTKSTIFPNRYPQVADFVASFEETDIVPPCEHCRLNMNDPCCAPCFDCNGQVKTGRSYYRPKCYPVKNENPLAAVAVDVSGLPEFDRLLTLLKTIHIMTDDTRVRAFIEAEITQISESLSDRPLTHTFDLLAEAQRRPLHISEEQRTYLHAAAVDLSVPISYLDDARQLAIEGTAEYVVLETVQKYLEGLSERTVGTANMHVPMQS